jgi:16S rRNA (guanine1207-N2)-methyltransferase
MRELRPLTLPARQELAAVAGRVLPPVAIVLGSPHQAATVAAQLALAETVCYQMDLYQAGRLQEELSRQSCPARVVTSADLWDLPADYQTVLYLAPLGGERSLKIDMVEQAYHVLRPNGSLIVLSPYPQDDFFPGLVKKTFGRAHMPAAGQGQVIWAQRQEQRPRRRHEVTIHATVGGDGPLQFLSRPGVFSYGKFDLGARALLEAAIINTGDRVLDLGCGCGTNGVFAGRRSATGHVAFVDSNLRGIALAELNARASGLTDFEVIASSTMEQLPSAGFDMILANPPYYAQNAIARQFVEGARRLLRPGGRFYLVTKQDEAVAPLVAQVFGYVEVFAVRGYRVLLGESSRQ